MERHRTLVPTEHDSGQLPTPMNYEEQPPWSAVKRGRRSNTGYPQGSC